MSETSTTTKDNESKVDEFDEQATEFVGTLERTPYQFAGLLSEVLGRKVQPQMMYIYTKKGYIAHTINSVGHQVIVPKEQARFLAKRLRGDAEKAAQTERELEGNASNR